MKLIITPSSIKILINNQPYCTTEDPNDALLLIEAIKIIKERRKNNV